jgi:hypothetical protein
MSLLRTDVKLCFTGDSGASMDIALWGERATTFPAEQVHKDGQTTLQVMIFVGTLVKCYTTTQVYVCLVNSDPFNSD